METAEVKAKGSWHTQSQLRAQRYCGVREGSTGRFDTYTKSWFILRILSYIASFSVELAEWSNYQQLERRIFI